MPLKGRRKSTSGTANNIRHRPRRLRRSSHRSGPFTVPQSEKHFMRFPVQITLAAAILCSASAFAQALDAASGDNATPSRFSCLSSSGQALTVWADRHRAVVAVAPGPGDPRLPAFAAPLVHQPVAALLQGFAANTGYQVRTEGPAYDLDHVLMVGQVRLSCAEARRG